MSTRSDQIIQKLKSLGNEEDRQGKARVSINAERSLGIRIPVLRALAKDIGRDQQLAEELWATGYHEARILAGYLADPAAISEATIERWAADFDSWDLVDHLMDLVGNSLFGYQKAFEWSAREEEFVKRAGFVIMCHKAIHDKAAPDERLLEFFPLIKRESTDERLYVRKAVNWALRQIGKRNRRLNQEAIRLAEEIAQLDSKAARWIASDALRELQSEKVQAKLDRKK